MSWLTEKIHAKLVIQPYFRVSHSVNILNSICIKSTFYCISTTMFKVAPNWKFSIFYSKLCSFNIWRETTKTTMATGWNRTDSSTSHNPRHTLDPCYWVPREAMGRRDQFGLDDLDSWPDHILFRLGLLVCDSTDENAVLRHGINLFLLIHVWACNGKDGPWKKRSQWEHCMSRWCQIMPQAFSLPNTCFAPCWNFYRIVKNSKGKSCPFAHGSIENLSNKWTKSLIK